MLALATFLIRCASTGRPNGGPEDETPPSIVHEKSDSNFQTNFIPEKIILTFDEWIELKNPNREILISPPFFKKPKVEHRGKKVTVTFPEEEPLRPDATYTINFGNSIVDFTEGNAVEGYKFLFATGDKIDSLSYEGKVIDAYGGDAVEGVLVLMHDMLEDSVMVKDKPFYYTRTDKEGLFKFENIKNDTFQIIVLDDKDLDYLLSPSERIAFLDSLVVLNDSTEMNKEFRLSLPYQSPKITESNSKTPGRILAILDRDVSEVPYSFLYPSDFTPIEEIVNDTIRFWFSEPVDSVGIIFGIDTLDFNIKPFDSLFYNKKLRLSTHTAKKKRLAPFEQLGLFFSAPLASIDTALIMLSDMPLPKPKVIAKDSSVVDSIALFNDSLFINKITSDSISIDSLNNTSIINELNDTLGQGLSIDSLSTIDTTQVLDTVAFYDFETMVDKRELKVNSKWKENHEYRLQILPGGLTDIYGRTNDTLDMKFETSASDEYGNILINLIVEDSLVDYIIHLRLKKKIIEKKVVDPLSKEKIEFKNLPVGEYNIHLIKDDDGNGKWTSGDFWEKRQPELLRKYTLEELRQNWDLEANLEWEQNNTISIDSTLMNIDSLSVPLDSLQQKKTDPSDQNRGRKF